MDLMQVVLSLESEHQK